jgi:hypothetical protein
MIRLNKTNGNTIRDLCNFKVLSDVAFSNHCQKI